MAVREESVAFSEESPEVSTRGHKNTQGENFFLFTEKLNTNEKRDTLCPTVGETSEQCI